MPVKEENTHWISNLRAFATVSVIILHVSGRALNNPGLIPDKDWCIANLFDSAVRFCVPVFVMLSGTLLLTREERTGVFLKKRFYRLFPPFGFWAAVYLAAYYLSIRVKGGDPGFSDTMCWLKGVINNGIAIHFWYVFMISGLYLFIPVIGKWFRNAGAKEIWYFLIVWLISTCIVYFPGGENFTNRFHLTYFTGYIGYLILGGYLSGSQFPNRPALIFLLMVIGLLITSAGTYVLSASAGVFSEKLYGFLSPNIILLTVGVFLFFRTYPSINKKTGKIATVISRYSYGIYLVHVLVLSLLNKIGGRFSFDNQLFVIPFTSIICLSISLGLVYIVSRLPFGKYVSG